MANYWISDFIDCRVQIAETAVAATTSTDTFTKNGHGFAAGDLVALTSISGMTNVALNTTYVVLAAGLTTNVFKIAATPGGTAITVGTGSPNVIHMKVIDILYANEMKVELEEAEKEWKGDGQSRKSKTITGHTVTLSPDALTIEAQVALFNKTPVTSNLPDGNASWTYFGGETEQAGRACGLYGRCYAIKVENGIESNVIGRFWYPRGTIYMGGMPGLTTGEVAEKQEYTFAAVKTTQNVIGGALPGVSANGDFWVFVEEA